jgi:hypothetical protein
MERTFVQKKINIGDSHLPTRNAVILAYMVALILPPPSEFCNWTFSKKVSQ